MTKGATVRIFRREAPVRVLGPYARAVIWVQGCTIKCPGCIVPKSWDAGAGREFGVNELCEWVLAQPDIEGLTFSGGEPMLQAGSLCALVDAVRARRDMGVVCYTGYTYEYLLSQGVDLLGRVDLLIDGAYREDLHESLLWRGSSNQRLLSLTSRYTDIIRSSPDRSAGMEVVQDEDGAIGYAGVPALPGFRELFLRKMEERGIRLSTGEDNERRI